MARCELKGETMGRSTIRRTRRHGQAPRVKPEDVKPEEKKVDAICCDSCFFLDLADGECRCAPPTVFMIQDADMGSEWPFVDPGGWCGSWRDAATMKTLEQVWIESDGLVDFGLPLEEDDEEEEEEDSGE